jgi:iron complex outermembrane receptor protein
MKRSHLWVLNPCLLAMLSTSAWAEEQKEENIVVSASRAPQRGGDGADHLGH